jgi:hypothetical protein
LFITDLEISYIRITPSGEKSYVPPLLRTPELKKQKSEIRYDPFIGTSLRTENITQLEMKISSARDRNPLRMVFSSIEPLSERGTSLPLHKAW